MSRRVIEKIILVVVSLAISVTSAEYLYRHRERHEYYRRLATLPGGWKALPDDPRVYALYPNHHGYGRFRIDTTRSFAYRTNSDGLRGPDAGAKSNGVARVLALGDSYTFGWAVREDEAYPHQLGRLLASEGCRVEVINAGIPGHNTEQEFYQLRDLLPRYQPDVVLLGYAVNDAEPKWPSSPDVVYRYSGVWVWERLKQFVNDALPSSQRLFRAYLHVGTSHYLDGFGPDSPKWRESAAFFKRMVQVTGAASAELVVIIFPDFTQPFDRNYQFDVIHEKVSEWGRALSVTTTDLLPYFREEDSRQYRVEGDGHPNGLAYRKIARMVGRTLGAGPLARACRGNFR